MKEFYQKTSEEVLKAMGTTEKGITSERAAALLEEHGKNVLAEGKKKSVLQVFLEQFCDLLVIILIIAAIVSMFSGNTESTIVIIAVIVMNAILGTVQHQKAEKIIGKSKKTFFSKCKGNSGWTEERSFSRRSGARRYFDSGSRGSYRSRWKNYSLLFSSNK